MDVEPGKPLRNNVHFGYLKNRELTIKHKQKRQRVRGETGRKSIMKKFII
jgi:hypothetical protein